MKNYNQITHLNKMMIQDNVKPHKCEKCNFTTGRKSRLQSHIQKVHENLQPFVCQNCGKHFGYIQYFRVHLRICPNLTEKRQWIPNLSY